MMGKLFKRGSRVTAVLAMSAAVVLGLAGPASAAPGQNEATGIVAAGLVDAGPFAYANFPLGPQTDTLANVNFAGLVNSGTLEANADATSADATVQDLTVVLTNVATLNAAAVSSECSYDPETQQLTGSSSIVDGAVTVLGLAPITLEASPAANTTVLGLEGIATVILNRQTINADGSLTVDAIYIMLLNGQEIIIATSHCHPATLVIPVIAAPFAVGAGVLGLIGLGFFLYRRRETTPMAQV